LTVYIETSAAAKLLVEESESAALAEYLDELAKRDVTLISSSLLETELRRTATRHGLEKTKVSDVLDGMDILDLERSHFTEAGLLPGTHLRSLDALHVAAAVRAEAAAMVAYDIRQSEAAHAAGLRVVSPGTEDPVRVEVAAGDDSDG
jgi:predicted nucleic acid-binding protein